jgi:hypothetical protein
LQRIREKILDEIDGLRKENIIHENEKYARD